MYIATDIEPSREMAKMNYYHVKLTAKQSQKQYVNDEKLKQIVNNSALWEEKQREKITEKTINKLSKQEDNFLKIIGKENDELVFSNWIVYVLKNNKKIFKNFCSTILNFNISDNTEIKREYENIDIFIEDTDNKYGIVIENKIRSDINGIKYDSQNNKQRTQLDKYKGIAEKLFKNEKMSK